MVTRCQGPSRERACKYSDADDLYLMSRITFAVSRLPDTHCVPENERDQNGRANQTVRAKTPTTYITPNPLPWFDLHELTLPASDASPTLDDYSTLMRPTSDQREPASIVQAILNSVTPCEQKSLVDL